MRTRLGYLRFAVVGILLLPLMLLVSISAHAGGFMTPEYARAEYRPKTMVVIPPRAEIVKNKVTGIEQLVEEGSIIEDATSIVLKDKLGELGYQIRILTVEEVNADPGLQDMVRRMNERYDDELARMVKKGKDVRARRFTCGDEAQILAARLGAEALVMTRIQASGATGGQQVMAAIFGGSSGYAAMSVGIIAGDNGDVEAFFNGVDGGMSDNALMERPVETMTKVTKKTLKKYPDASEIAKVKKKWPQSTDREVPESGKSDDQVLADLEALLGEDIADEEEPEVETPDSTASDEEPVTEIAEDEE